MEIQRLSDIGGSDGCNIDNAVSGIRSALEWDIKNFMLSDSSLGPVRRCMDRLQDQKDTESIIALSAAV